LVEGNPAARVDGKPRAKRADLSEKVWTPEELHLFLESVGNDPHKVLWEVTALTGLRRGEVLGLRWSDVNLDEGELSVRRTWVMVGGSPRESSPKTHGSRRSVSLDTRTLAALRSHKVRQNELRLKSGQVWQDLGVVFTRGDGSHLRPDWVSRRFRKLVAEAGLPQIPFHGLRHSHATALLAAAQNPKVVQERLGH
jgi:integrase